MKKFIPLITVLLFAAISSSAQLRASDSLISVIAPYPNPVTGNEFRIRSLVPIAFTATVQIFDDKGKMVRQTNFGNGIINIFSVLVPMYSGGYWVKITQPNGDVYSAGLIRFL